MKTFVDLDQIDSRYFEKPYYLLPDGDEADEGCTVLRDAFAKTKKMAVGQLIMHGREHLIGITAHMNGLMLVILRYADFCAELLLGVIRELVILDPFGVLLCCLERDRWRLILAKR
jgi:non-homologous end joining protein Ku